MSACLVAVAAPVAGLFSYGEPPRSDNPLCPGLLVEVPFGKGLRRGVVVELGQPAPEGLDLKPVKTVVDPQPFFSQAMIATLSWAADYYLVPPGEMFFAALPPAYRKVGGPLGPSQVQVAEATTAAAEQDLSVLARRAPVQAEVLARLIERGPEEVAVLAAHRSGVRSALRSLEGKGLVSIFRRPKRMSPPVADLPEAVPVEHLTGEQEAALGAIGSALDAGRFKTCLLHGVTGSGKTEVYLRAIAHGLAQGRGAILLVPEISLTPQLMSRVTGRFGDRVAVLHSGLGQGERMVEFQRLRDGRAQVALGARSAVFAPVANPGLIVVDEEHDGSYKQSERLPYNGRDLALVRAREENAVVLLGSATPSLESYAHAKAGRYGLVALTHRVHARPMPRIDVVDLRTQLDPLERAHTLSPALAEALAETLDRGEQAILFLNRRGYSAFALCKDCGDAVRCSNCSVALVHHLAGEELRCHYCGLTVHLPLECPGCKKRQVQLFGLGTEKCEQEVVRRFPGARVIRMDSDSVSGRGKLQEIVGRFVRGEADVLVGTQMVTKGHDIPGVTLVGVVLADLGLHLPDFRAAERTFQLLTQVAGRAGRGARPGRVIIQSFLPRHESITMARESRFEEFMDGELARREALGYPPARRLLMVRVSHPLGETTADLAKTVARIVRGVGKDRIQVLGPVVSPLARLRGRYRWQMLVKSQRIEDLHRVANATRDRLRAPAGTKILFDVDPVDML